MALTTRDQCKAYLRIQHTAEDTVVDALLASAIAYVEADLQRPITAGNVTFVDVVPHYTAALIVNTTPVGALVSITPDSTPAINVTDCAVDAGTGIVRRLDGGLFPADRYTIVATVGLSARSDYATRVEPVINQAILDTVAELYQRRNPSSTAQSEGGGVSVSYAGGISERTRDLLAAFRMVRSV